MTNSTPVRQRNYLGKDFNSLRSQILDYARIYYPDRIQDFSESSLGGLFLDMAAYVGDNMSFYLDHQFGELNPQTAVENINIQTHLRNSGVPIVGSSPSVAEITFSIQVPSFRTSSGFIPLASSLPLIQAGSVFKSKNEISFTLIEDIDFTNQVFEKQTGVTRGNDILTFILSKKSFCVSGQEIVETFDFQGFVPFRRITLKNPNVSEIISVTDTLGNTYYHVDTLTNDVVYRNVMNTSFDNEFVKDSIKIIPAPYRFTTEVEIGSRSTSLIFGGGSAESFEDDVIPDPSEFSIPYLYTKTFDKISLNPRKLLQNSTFGISGENTKVSVRYRHGGSLSHNVSSNSITSISILKMTFPNGPTSLIESNVRTSAQVNNFKSATGGEDAPTVEELVSLIPLMRSSQDRIVTKEDLISRIYTLPSNFGRVFRAAVRPNPNNNFSSQLFILSRNKNGELELSQDSLKRNIVRFLSPYRLISDAIDILDAQIINLSFKFEVTSDPTYNKNILGQQIIKKLTKFFEIKNFHIDQPINKSDIVNEIFSVQGIMSVDSIQLINKTSNDNSSDGKRTYSTISFDVETNTVRNSIVVPPPGGIFEIKYPIDDIEGIVRW